MNRAAAVSFALLLGSGVLAAQTASQNQLQIEIQKTTSSPDGQNARSTHTLSQLEVQRLFANTGEHSCPVSLHAQQSAAAFARQVNGDDGDRPRDVAQRLHLVAAGPSSKKVVAANVTVHGFAAKPRMVQTMETGDGSNAAKTMDVRFAAGTGQDSAADLWVPGLSAVRSIDVNAVTYSDGSTWKLADGRSCSSLVDGVMLISSRVSARP
jgi:hypothetical protein